MVISPDGYALTNFHVTHEAGIGMKCGMADGKLYDAVIVGLDPTGDVAMIKLLGRDDFPAAELGDSDKCTPAIGASPSAIRSCWPPIFIPRSATASSPACIAINIRPARCWNTPTACRPTPRSIPGNSGGPLFNAQGQLIGINGRGSFEKRGRVNVGVGYAISINQIKNFSAT